MITYIRLSGSVQKVGFRVKAKELAKDLSLNGFVKNHPSGDVEIVLVDAGEKLPALLEQLQETFSIESIKSFESDAFDIIST